MLIEITMNNSSGVYQVDGLLKEKLRGSGLEPYVEVVAHIDTEAEKSLYRSYRLETSAARMGTAVAGSSNGRTRGSGSRYLGSNPSPAASKSPEPGFGSCNLDGDCLGLVLCSVRCPIPICCRPTE